MHADLLNIALEFLERGIATIPIASRDRKKLPLVRYKRLARTLPKESTLRGWYEPGKLRENPNGLAIVAARGIACRDFDKGGAGYLAWAEQHPTLARTIPTVRTHDGYHCWHDGADVQRIIYLGDGEYRGAGYTLIPPSKHYEGSRYEWIIPPSAGFPIVDSSIFIGSAGTAANDESDPLVNPLYGIGHSLPISVTTIEGAIEATLPTAERQRNIRLFDLARALRHNVGLADTRSAKPHVREWFDRCRHIIRTKSFDETWADFVHAFKRCLRPLGLNPLDAAAMKTDPENLPPIADKYDSAETHKLISLCFHLARGGRNGWFFISCHDVAGRVKAHPMRVWRTLQMLVEDGVLEAGEKGIRGVKANRYRWAAGGLEEGDDDGSDVE